MKKDLLPIFLWAKENGDANIYDRILVKVMPELLKKNIKLTSCSIETSEQIIVSEEIYQLVLESAEKLVGVDYV